MALILNIDTAVDAASVCLAEDEEVLSVARNERMKDHASWLHMAIKKCFEECGSALKMIDAVAITGGPGSYTGLRIGMAAAKGLCYAMNKPLISLNTLLVMANAAKNSNADLLCPMIDARRMEVYTAIYTKELRVIKEPTALLLDEKSFDEELSLNSICFFGNGSHKFRAFRKNERALYAEVTTDAVSMISLSEKKYGLGDFADLAYAEPLYLKEFYTPGR